MRNKILVTAAVLLPLAAGGAENRLTVQTNRPGAEIPATMWGIFFEDINHGADGGLYAEMVKNRSFEYTDRYAGWTIFGNVQLLDDGPFERNPHYVRLGAPDHPSKHTGLENEGYFGMGFKKNKKYRVSFHGRMAQGEKAVLEIVLTSSDGGREDQAICSRKITVKGDKWEKYCIELTPKENEARGHLRIFLEKPKGGEEVDLEHISLFPADSWRGEENGLRADLAQRLADLKPGVFRFPGGCIVEGTDLKTRYQWKNTVGPVENRPLNESRWHYTFTRRFFPEYFQSGGLGFYEYFRLAEDMGAEPLPVVSVGLACQYQNKREECHVPLDSLGPYIQDALDLIEFANGDSTSTWGSVRASMGHPAPFGMKYIGIGNEQWGKEYTERLEQFIKVLRKEHPEIEIVGSSGPKPEGKEFDMLWPEMRRLGADLVDEHYYSTDEWMLAHADRYDRYSRKGPKVFAGEYACHPKGKKRNHLGAALTEAAFMTGLERNADIVEMATYAPLLAHVDGWQWRPDMIWFDNLRSMPTASYLVQQLYSMNRGTRTVPLTMDGHALTGAEGQNGLYGSATIDEESGEYIIKLSNTTEEPQEVNISFAGLGKGRYIAPGRLTSLSGDPDDENTLDEPGRIHPVSRDVMAGGKECRVTLDPGSFNILRLPVLKKGELRTVPRDTSFTLNATAVKTLKRFPEARGVEAQLPQGVKVERDIVYSRRDSSRFGVREMHLDLFRPENDSILPALVMIHGGGWNSGDKSLQHPLAIELARRGYVTIPVEYRLIPEALYPAGLHDVKEAIAWVRAHAGEYGIDPGKIAVSGCSAGGQLATLAGVTNGSERHAGTRVKGVEDCAVQGIISIDGVATFLSDSNIADSRERMLTRGEMPVNGQWLGGLDYENPEHWREASATEWITARSAPILFINSLLPRYHDGRDTLIEHYNRLGISTERVTIPVEHHTFWLFEPWFTPTADAAESFLRRLFKEK